MIRIIFSQEDIEKLRQEAMTHIHPRVRQKTNAVYLKALGINNTEICKICAISLRTLKRYLSCYSKSGIEGLKVFCVQPTRSKLYAHRTSIEEEFRRLPPTTVCEAMGRIKQLTGIELGYTQVRLFLLRIGMKPRVVGSLPAKADPAVQEEFLNSHLQPALDEATKGKRQVFFVDASHFVWGLFLGVLWCFERVFVPTPSGRQRFNVLGALNAVTHEIVTITNDAYINAHSIIALLHKLREKHPNELITLVLDNAPYQKCDAVREVAELLQIELLYLPPYSPNLNLIERLWKFVKKECLKAKYHMTFEDFKTVITNCIESADPSQREKLASLLSLKFQMFPKEYRPVKTEKKPRKPRKSKEQAA